MNRLFRTTWLVLCIIAACTITSSVAHAADWMDPDWSRRIEFSAIPDSIEGSGSFSEFTLLLNLDTTSFAPVFLTADSGGSDLVLTAADGITVLDHELVSYDPVLGVAELWFKADFFSDTENTFYLYYDNNVETPEEAALRASLPGDAWASGTLAAYHFSEDPSLGTLTDWGPLANDAIAAVSPTPVGPGWTSSNLVDGAVGKAWEYDGVDLWTYATGVNSADSSFTISAWFANSDLFDAGAVAFSGPNGIWGLSFQRTQGEPRGNLDTLAGFITWLPSVLDSDLHQYTWTVDAETDTARFFYDGIEQSIWLRFTHDSNLGPVYSHEEINGQIGIAGPWAYNALDLSDGIVDEYRISEGIRSPEWLRTAYRNQKNQATFFTVLGEECPACPTGIGSSSFTLPLGRMSVAPNPFRAVANIEVETDALDVAVRVYDVKGRLVRTLPRPDSFGGGAIRFLWNGRDDAGTRVSNGIYYIRAQNGQAAVSSKVLLVR